jgi:hypothetical protein
MVSDGPEKNEDRFGTLRPNRVPADASGRRKGKSSGLFFLLIPFDPANVGQLEDV